MVYKMKTRQRVGEEIKAHRICANITQVEMAKLLGVARQTYLDMESGKTELRRNNIELLSRELGMPLSCFFPSLAPNITDIADELRLLALELERLNDATDLTSPR